jgi:redox-sensitive bicupin YhaK (pirin superfamily)
MIALRKSDERGATKLDWLDSKHSFSFADYRDPGHVHFGPLRVINEDVVAPGRGFAPHSHQDMEIVTYILSGALQHKDSIGSGGVIRRGEVQRMSAGSGITHSEFNASNADPVHLLQIWIFPTHANSPPSYEQKRFDEKAATNALLPIAVPKTRARDFPGAVGIDQDATIYAGRLTEGGSASLALASGRRVWVQVAKGALAVNGTQLHAGDGAGVTGEAAIDFRAHAPAEVLVFDLP